MSLVTKVLRYLLICASTVCVIVADCYSQTETSPLPPLPCVSDVSYFRHLFGGIGSGMGLLPLPPFDTAAIITCGKIDVYYEDINSHLNTGFDDTTALIVWGTPITKGEQRRNTLCGVLSYIQSIFDFSNVSDTEHLRLYVDKSFAPISYPATIDHRFYAVAAPGLDEVHPGIRKGWVCDYITSASWHLNDSLPGNICHGFLQVNFDRLINPTFFGNDTVDISYVYQNDHTAQPECNRVDLYSVLLHEVTHCLGWFNLIGFRTDTSERPFPRVASNIFSGMDWSYYVGDNSYPLSLTKVLLGTASSPTLDTNDMQLRPKGNYWLNNNDAPANHPVYSSGGGYSSYLGHLDDQPLAYTFRQRISPGDRGDIALGPVAIPGYLKRRLSKVEINGLCSILGYKYIGADSNVVIKNHTPYSKKMAQYSITSDNYGYFTEAVVPDDTTTNNIGDSVVVDLTSLYGSDLIDADITDTASIYIDTTTLVNFRGCGLGGNNHLLLKVRPDCKSVVYKPRVNFYGKAQFGFNITDGKDRGSFRVITIEVFKGNNVGCTAGDNMLCNPDFEEGSEVNRYNDSAESAITNSILFHQRWHESKWQGVSFSDSHPYCFNTNYLKTYNVSGINVSYSHTGCGLLPRHTSEIGLPEMSIGNGSLVPPMPKDSVGIRYQKFNSQGGSYYYLMDTMWTCSRYKLEFDIQTHHSIVKLRIGGADHIVDISTIAPALNYTLDTDYVVADTNWRHVSIPFRYCGAPSHILYLGNPDSTYFLVDSLVLKKDTAPPPLFAITITQHTPLACVTELTTKDTNAHCDVTYTWATDVGTILSYSDDSSVITVPSNISATYTVTASDQCNLAHDTSIVVDMVPGPIAGILGVCVGSVTTLSNSIAGGTWSSDDIAIATVDTLSGIVTGIAVGTVTISYQYCGHTVTADVTVNTAIPPITGTFSVCIGATTALSDIASGGTWASSDTAVATIDATGIVSGISTGTTTITYSLGPTCYALSVITVNTLPVLGAIMTSSSFMALDTFHICEGSLRSLSYYYYLYTGGLPSYAFGDWTIGDTTIASFATASTGVSGLWINGVSTGITTITYSLHICGTATTTASIMVDPAPSISGTTTVCPGNTITLSASTGGGSWTSSSGLIATVDAGGIVTGVSGGTALISYTLASTGCFDTLRIAVTPLPDPIGGIHTVCAGSNRALTYPIPGGTWSSSNTAIATVGLTGMLSGVSGGTATITYTLLSGCYVTALITVNPLPDMITGTLAICQGTITTLNSTTSGGTWSSSAILTATITSGGVAAGISTGTATITYTLPSGCFRTAVLSVNPLPTITGGPDVCTGNDIFLFSDIVGSTWSSANTAIATIGSASGILTGVAAGTSVITCSVTATGCYTTVVVTVTDYPPPITGTLEVCAGSGTTLSNATPGGVWATSNPLIALVDITGHVSTLIAGTVYIYYVVSPGCAAIAMVTANPNPSAITGPLALCQGELNMLTSTPLGGTWSSSDAAIADVYSITGDVYAASVGTAYITYTLATGCYVVDELTVNPLPDVIASAGTVCEGGNTLLTSGPPGGTWMSSAPLIATIGSATGSVTGVAAGFATMTYTLPTGCLATTIVTVDPLPLPITGPSSVCTGNTITLASATAGGTWESSAPSYATIGSSTGIVTGVSPGILFMVYILPTGCYTVTSMTVNSSPGAITGGNKVCVGNTITLNCTPAGGTWSVDPPASATISATGVLSGSIAGTVTVTYTLPATGCYSTLTVTVGAAVAAITGNDAICFGAGGITLTPPTSGGTWSSSNISIATVGSLTGMVLAMYPGTAPSYTYTSGSYVTITYTAEPGCNATHQMMVFHNDGSCSPCAQFATAPFNTLGSSTFITETSLTGNYYLANNVTVINDVVAQDAVIFIKPGVNIKVQPNRSFTSNGSHLFSCGTGMWKGIELEHNAGMTARIVLQGSIPGNDTSKSTLIEDAETAVMLNQPNVPNSGGSYIIDSRNTIFNRNNNGMLISRYNQTTPVIYPIRVHNTTFTCRILGTPASGYPLVWPGNYDVGGLKNSITPVSDYHSPFNITSYTETWCRNGTPAYNGVRLDSVGKTTGSIYAGVEIGVADIPSSSMSPNYYRNMYDLLGCGINALNANFTSLNSVYQYTRTVIPPGSPWPAAGYIERPGIYSEMNDGQRYEVNVISRFVMGGPHFHNTTRNQFYDCMIGVYSKDYNRVQCIDNEVRTTQTTSTPGSGGWYGFLLQSSSYEDVKVNENKIYNIANGVSFVSSHGGGYYAPAGPGLSLWVMPWQNLGNIAVNDNEIQATTTGTVTATDPHYVSFGIAVQNTLPGGVAWFTPTFVAGQVHTDDNTIRDAYRGILVSGYRRQPAMSIDNDITVRANGGQKCWGINHSNNLEDKVTRNKVEGHTDINRWYGNDSMRAYIGELNNALWMTCNYANNTGRGYEFFHSNLGTRWMNNEMVLHNKGLVLNSAEIGQQGWALHPADNYWSNTTWWDASTNKAQTYVLNSPAASASPLYVHSVTATNPTENDGFLFSVAYTSSSLIVTTPSYISDCPLQYPGDHTSPRYHYEPNVTGVVAYSEYTDARKWIAQQQVWDAVQVNTTLTDSSVTLAQFKTMATGSRLAYLDAIEEALVTGDHTTAASLLASTPAPLSPALCIDTATGVIIKDDSTIDYVIDTHKEFYNIYLRYLQYTMDSTDSVRIPVIAELCPLEYGSVVYKARALYTTVFNDLKVWCEGCDEGQGEQEEGEGQRPTIKPTSDERYGQAYMLYPNPNDGNITLVQKISDTSIVQIDVSDVLGRSVFNEEVRFREGNYRLNLNNTASGMYVTSIIDSRGRKYIFKFVKR